MLARGRGMCIDRHPLVSISQQQRIHHATVKMTVKDAQHLIGLEFHMVRRQHRQHIGLRMVNLVKDKQARVGNRCIKEHHTRARHRVDPVDELLRRARNHMWRALIVEQCGGPNPGDLLKATRDALAPTTHRSAQARVCQRQLVPQPRSQAIGNTSQTILLVQNAQKIIGDLHRAVPRVCNVAMNSLVLRPKGAGNITRPYAALVKHDIDPVFDVLPRAR